MLKTKPGKDHPTAQEIGFYDQLCEQMMRTMLELEGKDPDVEEASYKSKPGMKPTARVNTLGNRIRAVKERIRKVKNLPEKKGTKGYDDIALLEIGVEEGPPGTPKGNTSIRQHFAPKK